MTTFTYNRDIPNGPNNPSADQPLMKVNTNSTDDLINVDHVSFGQADGGTHRQSTYSAFATPGAQSDPQGVAYTQAGQAAPAHPMYFFKNSQGVFALSALRAFGVFTTGAPGALPVSNGLNIVSIVQAGAIPTTFTITLSANTTNSNDALVFINTNHPVTFNSTSYTFAANVLTIQINAFTPFTIISFAVLQI